jgi:proteasome lid subunit RPN8/RPN11
MDDEIRFGELEEAPRSQRVRPDQNRHWAVVPYQSPGSDDLPIFVDVDVLREMEAHARSDTSVELGGVLLGGQYEDEEGHPFVLVTDSLRAEHFESTKGSFKFTHETWSAISRQREEFPADTQMVGWYHTHPGWGVFLSGMDTFICDHFFNKPLDVALVIDPCQGERAFFQWTADGERRPRVTGGFYLTASRFRQSELETYTTQLEGQLPMPNDPRYAGGPGPYPPLVVQMPESKPTWLSLAVVGLLTMQFLVLALLAWRIVTPPPAATPAATRPADPELAAQRSLLDRVIGQLEVAPEGVVASLEQQRQKNEELQASNLGLLAQVRELARTQQETEQQVQQFSRQNDKLRATIDRLEQDKATARSEIDELRQKLVQYEPETSEEKEDVEAGAGSPLTAWIYRWKWYIAGGIAILLAIAAGAYACYGPSREHGDEQEQLREHE